MLVYNRTDIATTRTLLDEGDIIHVANGGHSWGREELRTTKFLVLHISDKTVREITGLWDWDAELTDPAQVDADGDERVIKQRKFFLDIDTITSQADRDDLRNGRLVTTWNVIRSAVRQKTLP